MPGKGGCDRGVVEQGGGIAVCLASGFDAQLFCNVFDAAERLDWRLLVADA